MIHFWFGFFLAAMVQAFLKFYVRLIMNGVWNNGRSQENQRNDIRKFSAILLATPTLALSFVITWIASWSIFGNDHGFWIFWTYAVLLGINAVRLNDYFEETFSRIRLQSLFHEALRLCMICLFFLALLYGIMSMTSTMTTPTTSINTANTTKLTTTEFVTSTTSDTSTNPTSGCGFPNWQGDKVCDDMNNNADCDYDGGDCCGDFVDTSYCRLCQCLDPTHTTPSTTMFATSTTSFLKSTSQTSNTQSTLTSSVPAATTTVAVSTSSNASNTTPQSTIQTSSTLSTTTLASTTSVTTCRAEHPYNTSGKILYSSLFHKTK